MTTVSQLATLQMIENELNERAPGMRFVLAIHVLSNGSGDILATFTTETSPIPQTQSIGSFSHIDAVGQALIDAQEWMESRLKKSEEILEELGIDKGAPDDIKRDSPDMDVWEALKMQLFPYRTGGHK